MCLLRSQRGAGQVERVCDLQRLRRARVPQPKMLRVHLRLGRVGMCTMQEESVRKFYQLFSRCRWTFRQRDCFLFLAFRVMQRRAGEWLLRQLEQMKSVDNENDEMNLNVVTTDSK